MPCNGLPPVAQRLKRLPAMQETWVRSLGQEDPLEKEMAPHSSILAWRIPWTEEPGRLQSTGSQRLGHDWATSLHFALCNSTSLLRFWILFACVHVWLIQPRGQCVGGRAQVVPCIHCSMLLGCRMCMLRHFSRVWLCDPMNCGLPGSSVCGILQARILEWVAMPSSRGSSPPMDPTHVYYVSCIIQVGSLPVVPPGKPMLLGNNHIHYALRLYWLQCLALSIYELI